MSDYLKGIDSSLFKQEEIEPDATATEGGWGDALSDIGEVFTDPNDWLAPVVGGGAAVGAWQAREPIARGVAATGRGVMAGGRFRLKAGIAANAYELGQNFATDVLNQQTDTRRNVVGGAAVAGTYIGTGQIIKGLSTALTDNFKANIAVGSWSGQVDEAMKAVRAGARKGAELEVKREFGINKRTNRPYGKDTKRTAEMKRLLNDPKFMEQRVNQRVKVATENVEKALEKQIKRDIFKGKKGISKSFDKIKNQLKNSPRNVARLQRFLASKFPKVAAKLAASTTGLLAPEAVSSVVGAFGLGWTAYDIWQISEAYPQIGKQIHDILFGPQPDEGDIITGLQRT